MLGGGLLQQRLRQGRIMGTARGKEQGKRQLGLEVHHEQQTAACSTTGR